jgi:hypothetical protein
MLARNRLELPVPEAVAYPHHGGRGHIRPKLIGEIGNVVQVKLRADEDVVRHEELDANAGVDLEVIRIPNGLNLGTADGGAYATALGDGETSLSAAKAALYLHYDTLLVQRRENSIHVVERLAVLQNGIIALSGLKGGFDTEPITLSHHDRPANPKEEAAQLRSRNASRVSGNDAGAKRCIINATAGGLGEGGSETEIQIEGTLGAGVRDAEQQQGKQGKVSASALHGEISYRFWARQSILL